MIDLQPPHRALIEKILRETVPECTVWAFGSRVTGTARKHSDLDLLLDAGSEIPWQRMGHLREAFEVSILPIRVDVIDRHTITEKFYGAIREQCEVMQTPGK